MKILVVEDDLLVADTLKSTLSAHNYAVEVAHDGRAGLDCIEAFDYDLLLLDVMLPELDGIALCRHVRSQGYMMPILLLTSNDSKHARAVGLDAGADDYVVKPFDPEELSARIRALLRRGKDNVQPILTWKDLTLDPRNCEVTYQDRVLTLTPKEYALLELFLRHKQRLFSCGAILEHLWTYEDTPGEEAVRTHIKGLRHKLKAVGAPHNLVETVYGIGYRLKSFDPLSEQHNTEVLFEVASTEVPFEVASDGVNPRSTGNNVGAAISPSATPTSPSLAITAAPPATIARSAASTDATRERAMAASPGTSQMLADIWNRYYDQTTERLQSIEQVIVALQTGSAIGDENRRQAKNSAHTLAGTLGTFGLPLGSKAAKRIELLLDANNDLNSAHLPELQRKLAELQQEISSKMTATTAETATPVKGELSAIESPALADVDRGSIAPTPTPQRWRVTATEKSRPSTRLLVITAEPDLVASLRDVAAGKLEITSATKLVTDRLSLPLDLILFDLDCCNDSMAGLAALSSLDRDYPNIPILVLSQPARSVVPVAASIDCNESERLVWDRSQLLHQRVEVARRGGRMFLSKPATAEEILAAVDRVLDRASVSKASITIVDDDLVLLEGLNALLSRSKMKVTTLSEPSRFWDTLETSKPDLLILDLDMPTYNGIELCRAVRTDPHWANLPIMFLSAHTAKAAIDRVFAAGADDFITKPASATELVTRIINRLERIEQQRYSANALA